MKHSHMRQYQFEEGRGDTINSLNLPEYFFTYTNVTKKRPDVNECYQKKGQGSEIMIGFKKGFELMNFFKNKGLYHKF